MDTQRNQISSTPTQQELAKKNICGNNITTQGKMRCVRKKGNLGKQPNVNY